MAQKTPGGPAFPVPKDRVSMGMDLRDWFAGLCLQSLVGGTATSDTALSEGIAFESYAKQAYRFADAMLAERKPAQTDPPEDIGADAPIKFPAR